MSGPIANTPPTDLPLSEADKDVLLDTYRKTNVRLTTQLGDEQERFDKVRSLCERLLKLDELSLAARPHEHRAIEAEFHILCPEAPTRRNEP